MKSLMNFGKSALFSRFQRKMFSSLRLIGKENLFVNKNKKSFFSTSNKGNNDNKNDDDVSDSEKDIEDEIEEQVEKNNQNKQKNEKIENLAKKEINKYEAATFEDLEPQPEIIENLEIDKEQQKDRMLTFEEEQNLNNFAEKQEKTENDEEFKRESYPLVYLLNPVLPYSRLILNNPNRNDLFFGLILKYGKITVIDEDTTQIDDISVFFEKEETQTVKAKKEFGYTTVLATLCRIICKKQQLIIEGLDKLYEVKTVKTGKYKFFNPKENNEINLTAEHNLEYLKESFDLVKSVLDHHDYITEALGLDESHFGDFEVNFPFSLENIKEAFNEYRRILVENEQNEEEVYEEFYREFGKYLNYFILKVNTFSNNVYGYSNDFVKILHKTDFNDKLSKVNEIFDNITKLLKLKYEQYQFPKNVRLNFENPFTNNTAEDISRIFKYKEAIDNKISELDAIEKQKEECKVKLSKIKNMTDETRNLVEKEITKISTVNLENENAKRFEYVNHVLSLPWDSYEDPKWDIDQARKVLDSNLYGLNETKERIYEFIAKNLRKENKKGCVILLTGGPGTGKTRIAKLIGEALQRKVGFVSLAGVSDGKTVLGFKRTYVSSTPGLFIREMQKVGVNNPVIVIDEIDKVSYRSTHSNIHHALLQLLNPEENHRFTDHYLEIPFDFSNTVFVLTSNNKQIFGPLIDRMEIIEVDPYVYYEKFLIAKNYALNQILEDYHYDKSKFEITDKALYKLIFEYCKSEAGVRKVKKLLESLVRKVNSKLELSDKEETTLSENELIQINSKNIHKIIDEPKDDDTVLSEMIHNGPKKPGFCIGLFVSSSKQSNSWGDASIFSLRLMDKKSHIKVNEDLPGFKKHSTYNELLESLKNENKQKDEKEEIKKMKKLKQKSYKVISTGNLGKDSLESLEIALHVAGKLLNNMFPNKFNDFFYKHDLLYDCPKLLQPKSGPSAGVVNFLIAMSLALEKPVIPHLAMTGEIAINGSVLKIGGVKEKAQGAQRYGVTTLVIPIGNKADFIELPENLKNSFEKVFFAENCEQVYRIGFGLDTTGIDKYVPENFIGDIEESLSENILNRNNIVDKMF